MRRSPPMTEHDEKPEVPDQEDRPEGAAVRVPPPIVFAGAVVLAVLLGWIWPRDPWVGGLLRWMIGLASVGGGIALIVTALGLLRGTDQDPKPWLPTPTLVTEGPYTMTRNPIYLGFVSILVGLGTLLGNGWFAITAVLAALAVQKLAIEPEEAYLEEKFGDDYRAYKRRVRRWL
jgi:protein-S-isoprenylcysteine O-methyltransferase Ste14